MTELNSLSLIREAYRLKAALEVEVMLIEPGALNEHLAAVSYILGGGTYVAPSHIPSDEDDIRRPRVLIDEQGIAEIPVHGLLYPRPSALQYFIVGGMSDSYGLRDALEAVAQQPSVKGVLLDVDSPGGAMTGGVELAEAVRALSKQKPVVAWTGGDCCSLAYLVASGANELVASRTSNVGALGAYMAVRDVSERNAKEGVRVHVLVNKDSPYKAVGVEGRPYSKQDLEYLQQRVESSYAMMKETLGKNRPGIREEAYDGRVFTAAESQRLKLVDRIGDKSFARSVLKARMRTQGQAQFVEQ